MNPRGSTLSCLFGEIVILYERGVFACPPVGPSLGKLRSESGGSTDHRTMDAPMFSCIPYKPRRYGGTEIACNHSSPDNPLKP